MVSGSPVARGSGALLGGVVRDGWLVGFGFAGARDGGMAGGSRTAFGRLTEGSAACGVPRIVDGGEARVDEAASAGSDAGGTTILDGAAGGRAVAICSSAFLVRRAGGAGGTA